MKTSLRDAMLVAMRGKALDKGDGLGLLHFLRGWLMVQPEKDAELIATIRDFTSPQASEISAAIAEQKN